MTTDLRAALRDNRDTLAWLMTDQHEQQHDEIDADDNHREKRQRAVDALTRLVALADAPPTVAELLPRVDAGHEVRWLSDSGEQRRARVDVGALVTEYRTGAADSWTRWYPHGLVVADLTRPGRLVEVA